MPPINGAGLNDQPRLLPNRPAPLQEHPEQAIGASEAGLGNGASEHHQLMTQSQILQHEL
jgi:hypothetical protein